jgi:hypothetical protein
MNQHISRMLTLPWDPSIGFTKKMAPSSLNAFVLEEKESPLPHQFEIKGDNVYVANIAGYVPVIDRPLVLVVKNLINEAITSTGMSLASFMGKTLHQFVILRDEAFCLKLHDENSRNHFLIRCDSSGEITWSQEVSDIDLFQGEKLALFELSNGLLVVKYFHDEIIFQTWDAARGEMLDEWREPKATDQLHQVQEEEFIAISFNSRQQAFELLNYNVSTRQTTFQSLNNDYYGWFHHLIGTDRNKRLYLALGDELAIYSLEGKIIHQINLWEDAKLGLQEPLPDFPAWRMDKRGNLYFPYAEEAGLSIMKIQDLEG